MRRFAWVLLLLGLLGTMAAGGWWWYFQTRPEQRLQRGLAAIERGDWDKAEEIAVALDHSGAKSHAALIRGTVAFRQARVLIEMDRTPEAVPLLRAALTELRKVEYESPLHLDKAAVAGQCLYHLGNLRAAEEWLGQVVAERPHHVDAHRILGALYWDRGALALALDHLERVAELDPEDGRVCHFKGLIYKDLKQYPKARESYQEALRRGLDSLRREDARIELAEVLVEMGQFQEAEVVLNALDPLYAKKELPTVLRARCLAGQGLSDRLSPYLDDARNRYPRSADLLRLQGQLLADTGKRDQGLAYLEKAVEAAPHNPEIRYQLAQLYRRLGRTKEADQQDKLTEETRQLMKKRSDLTHQANADPWNQSVRRELAEVSRKLGETRLAEMWLRSAGPPREPQPKQP